MAIHLTPEAVKDIAENLEGGMRCFYNMKTLVTVTYPDPGRFDTFEESDWQEVIDKIDENLTDYLRFDAMDSRESFHVVEKFINQITNVGIKEKFWQAVRQRKPFQQFKGLLQYYPELLKEWYAFKDQCLIEYVNETVERYNSDNENDTDTENENETEEEID